MSAKEDDQPRFTTSVRGEGETRKISTWQLVRQEAISQLILWRVASATVLSISAIAFYQWFLRKRIENSNFPMIPPSLSSKMKPFAQDKIANLNSQYAWAEKNLHLAHHQ